MVRRAYAGGVKEVYLTSAVTDVATSLPVSSLTGVPNGSTGSFAVIVGKGTPNEEKMLASSSGGGLISIAQRGYDGTTPRPHSDGEEVRLVITAIDADEANAHVNATTGIHGAPGGVPLVNTTGAQTLSGKTMSGLLNTFTDIPNTAIPDMVADLSDEVTARIAGDTARYTKAESDALYATPSYAESYADGLMNAHEGDADPHDQYLMHDGTANRDIPFTAMPTGSMVMAQLATRMYYSQLTNRTPTDAEPIKDLGTITFTSAAEQVFGPGRLFLVHLNIKGFTTSGSASDATRFGVTLEASATAWWPYAYSGDILIGPRQTRNMDGGIGNASEGLSILGLYAVPSFGNVSNTITARIQKFGGSCNPTAEVDDGMSTFWAVQLT